MFARLRRAGVGVAALAGLRVELFALELREQFEQWLKVAVFAVAAIVLGCIGLGFVAVFVTVAFWDKNPLVALGIFAGLFLFGAVICAQRISAGLSKAPTAFSATIAEFRRDVETLDPGAAPAPPVSSTGEAPLPSAAFRDLP
ncbi:phage holin family protein [Quisquiliibacterium transsilvanicum]|uniref:Putative membrane protein YqjE n=1 Tax=Quisquiliibacterium transsilvanicum TaxID=1549638 RepID=A0A7W8M9W1_9BURK|nr:phage holin family protein [Quisquiliibacterium transsilvanicum]MBB5272504.1 putative membrane protein YqjE [Quisquiliibacterium transsilvanicum]